ncbi:hypothetical protein GF336_02035 [Candidatus Woesearchaeota archaeon]|nr:hypothetical protein [Candidatus Woesearchaeota archaeon]
MDLIKIKQDKERARSLFKLSMLRYDKISQFNIEKESSLIAESYYEICKELITGLLFVDGYKTLSHKDLIEYLKNNYTSKFSEHHIESLDMLRKKRNKIVYYGIFTDSFYIKRNRKIFEEIITILKNTIRNKLE